MVDARSRDRVGGVGSGERRVYTDGACLGNPGPGGWAWAIDDAVFASGAEAHTTNQRMEVRAVLEGLSAIDGPVIIVSDSAYVVRCFNDRWWVGWERRGWRNAKGQAVANQDLWLPLLELVRSRQVRFEWVKGHAGDPMNTFVDALASEAARTQQGRHGAR